MRIDLLKKEVVDETTPTWVIHNEMYELMDEMTTRARQLNYELSQYVNRVPDITQPTHTNFMESIKKGFRKIMEAIKRFIQWVKNKLFGIGPKTTRYIRRQRSELSKIKSRVDKLKKDVMTIALYSEDLKVDKTFDNVVYFSPAVPDQFETSWMSWMSLPTTTPLTASSTLNGMIKHLPDLVELIRTGDVVNLPPGLEDFLSVVGLRVNILGTHRETPALVPDPNFDIRKQVGTIDIKTLCVEAEGFNNSSWAYITGSLFKLLGDANRKLDHLEDCVVVLDNTKAELETIVSTEKQLEKESDNVKAQITDRMILLSNTIQSAGLLITNCVQLTATVEQNINLYLDIAELALADLKSQTTANSNDTALVPT